MNNSNSPILVNYRKNEKRKHLFLLLFLLIVILVAFFSIFIGTSNLSFFKTFMAIFGKGENMDVRIVQKIRIPRILAAIICGIGLSLSGLVMQTTLNNPMASPSTLGISNASVLGANVAIIMLSGGKVSTNNNSNWNSFNPYIVTIFAFMFSFIAILLILGLAKFRHFSPETLILAGVALSSLFSAMTTLLQYFATDTQLSAAVYWSFGDLGRVGYKEVIIMAVVLAIFIVVLSFMPNKMNALTFGDTYAKTNGVNTELLRFILLLFSSLMTACCIAFVGIIGFIGIMAPHIVRKFIHGDHKYLLPFSGLMGSLILLLSDDFSRVVLQGFSLPVGAITSLLGAPFFLVLIFTYERRKRHA